MTSIPHVASTAVKAGPIPFLDLGTADAPRQRGLGSLCVERAAQRLALPLSRVELQARVADRVAEVTMTQVFQNEHTEHLEAIYVFPLPGGAAVSHFEMQVGDRVVVGRVQERGEARRTYQQAMQNGKRAALLEQERDGVFTMSVGNLPPGQDVTVRVTWSERLPFFEDGTTQIRLPLVVAPRYVPGAPLDRASAGQGVEDDTDLVPDASRITPPRLAKAFDPKVALLIQVELLDGSGLADLRCSQHATGLRMEDGVLTVALAQEGERLDRDFVLRWRLAGDAVRTRLVVHRPEVGPCYGMLSIVPPARDGFLGTARDVVFVLDRSGSMEGVKMTSAARACSVLLHTLGPRDRFAIQAFDDSVEWLADGHFMQADEAGLERGEKFLRGIGARGGTELDGALQAALAAIAGRADSEGRVPVVVLLTDGQIGDESRVLKRLQKELGDARVFTVGIDTAVNEGFLKRLAAMAGGTSTFVTPGEALEEALQGVGREIGTPLVLDLSMPDAQQLAPARVPDLFAGRAVTVFLTQETPGALRVRGRFADGAPFETTVEPEMVALGALAQMWARARVAELEDRFRLSQDAAVKQEIVDLAVRHSILTRFTAFVAVDEAEVVNADGTVRTVVQPVEMPARWEMEYPAAPASMAAPAPMAMRYQTMAGACDMSLGAPPPAPGGMPGPIARGRASSLGGLIKKAKQVLGGGGGSGMGQAFGSAPPAARRPSPPPPAEPAAETSDRAVEEAVAELIRVVEAIRAEIAAGRIPSADPLEKARKALIATLASSALAARVPKLQTFVRSGAIELVAALRTPGIDAAALAPLVARHAASLQEARREMSGDAGAFWEGSI